MATTLRTFERDAPVTALEIEDLRSVVGWDRFPNRYERILKASYTHFTVREREQLIGFVNVISDGIGDAFLVDLMVHPEFQKKGIGRGLVATAIDQLTADGIRCIQVTFNHEHEEFYRRCGFELFMGGVIDNESPARRKSIPAVAARLGGKGSPDSASP